MTKKRRDTSKAIVAVSMALSQADRDYLASCVPQCQMTPACVHPSIGRGAQYRTGRMVPACYSCLRTEEGPVIDTSWEHRV